MPGPEVMQMGMTSGGSALLHSASALNKREGREKITLWMESFVQTVLCCMQLPRKKRSVMTDGGQQQPEAPSGPPKISLYMFLLWMSLARSILGQ